MADSAPASETTTTTAPIAETYSAEYVADLKKQLETKAAAEATLKAKFAVHEQRQRDQLKAMQPAVQEWIKEGLAAGDDHKHEMAPMAEFGDKLHEASNLDSAMPLARMITCHSAKIKREREEFSQSAAMSESLGKANKELEEVKSDRDSKASRIAELEALVLEKTTASEKMQEELAKVGVLKDTFEFSKASAREAGVAAGSSSAAPAAGVGGGAGAAAPFVDPLLAFVSAKNGSGNRRLMPTSSGNALLGSAEPNGIADALRFA